MRDYQMVSPSLDGILSHDSVMYEGLRRPIELLRILDGPRNKGKGNGNGEGKDERKIEEKERRILEEYFHDLNGVFMRKFSQFMVGSDVNNDETLKLQAMLQELIKVKKLLALPQFINA
jgi:hypothetical protein